MAPAQVGRGLLKGVTYTTPPIEEHRRKPTTKTKHFQKLHLLPAESSLKINRTTMNEAMGMHTKKPNVEATLHTMCYQRTLNKQLTPNHYQQVQLEGISERSTSGFRSAINSYKCYSRKTISKSRSSLVAAWSAYNSMFMSLPD